MMHDFAMTYKPSAGHCEERSDEAISTVRFRRYGGWQSKGLAGTVM
jgi:hypothetical protein